MVEVYADDSISGTNTKKRDEFNRMIEDCKAGKIDMILTKSISRFSRNTVDCLKYTRELKDMNIAVFFEKENINTLDAKGEVLMTIMAALAQQESESLSANVRLGIQFRNQQGKVQINHNWFLGYTKDENGKLIIVPEEAAVVQRIYAEYLDGRSFLQIKRGLEADEVLNGAVIKSGTKATSNRFLPTRSTSATRFFKRHIQCIPSKRSVSTITALLRSTTWKVATRRSSTKMYSSGFRQR